MFFGMFQISAQRCEGFKTITQGGWGTKCHGDNPGCYRDANFDAAFPDGIRIGNETNSITLTSSSAVKNFLPSGTTPRALNSGALIDPGQTYRNVLAGQLVTLTLSIGFDVYDADFGSNPLLLGDLRIRNGTFAGMTVNNFLQIANNAIGGEATGYSYSRLNAAASAINENFDEGTVDNGFLTCNPPQFLVSTLFNNPFCYGNLSGDITVFVTGGTAPLFIHYLPELLLQDFNFRIISNSFGPNIEFANRSRDWYHFDTACGLIVTFGIVIIVGFYRIFRFTFFTTRK
jgi:hypothetical protein